MNLQVILLRGISGSGKSTYARELICCSPDATSIAYIVADAYTGYLNEKFQYVWTPEACKAAHKWARTLFEEALDAAVPLIVVDNTNLKRKGKHGWGFYWTLAQEYEYKVKFVEFMAELEVLEFLAARNKHRASLNNLKQMLAAWEPLPDWCEVERRRIII